MFKRFATTLVFFLALSLVFSAVAIGELWKPTKTIKIVVPWAAGGSTDQSARLVAGILEPHLGQKVVVINQIGGMGTVGTKSVWDAPHDGYMWSTGAAADLGSYKARGFMDQTIRDWELFLSVANIGLVCVNPNTPYKTFGDLLQAFKDKPGKIKVATAGQASMGHLAIEFIKKYTGIEYQNIMYEGGNPAVIACVAGETDVVPQNASEQVDMVRAGKLRALAVLNDKPLPIKGVDPVPPITKWIPEFKVAPNFFGIWCPKDTKKEVVDTFGSLWDNVVKKSDKLKDYCATRAAIFDPCWGEEAQKKAFPFLQIYTWLFYDQGKLKMNPSEIGIPRPE